ncbi:MAG: U32 family peptidase [Alistipes putredinis]|nr:MAG: U32 family peptidase [Alistipes putredinis]
MDAGVSSFKIEGRLKDELYVRNIVAHYRAVIDEALQKAAASSPCFAGNEPRELQARPAQRFFSRMQGRYFIDGARRGVASFDTPKSTGEALGQVLRRGRDWFSLSGGAVLSAGDGICFLHDGEMRGTNVNRAEADRIWPNKMEGIEVGVRIYRNFDSAFSALVLQGGRMRTVDVVARLDMDAGGVGLTVEDENGFRAKGRIDMPLEAAKKTPSA